MARVFFSYSHTDEGLRDQLEAHLAMLKNQGLIESWHDRRITAGSELDEAIARELEAADVILLLVSADFLASSYCYSKEMTRAMERHHAGTARVIPVILRACDWTIAPFGKLLAAPKDGRAVASWPDRDEAFAHVAKQVRAAVEELHAKVAPAARGASTRAIRPPAAAATSPLTTLPRSSNLRLKKDFTQQDHDDFLHEAYAYVARFFQGSLDAVAERNPGVKGRFEAIDSRRCAATLYKNGTSVAECSVRLEGLGGRGSNCIAFSFDASARSGTYNEMLHVEATDQSLYLKPMGMQLGGNTRDQHLSAEGAAEFLWALFIGQLR